MNGYGNYLTGAFHVLAGLPRWRRSKVKPIVIPMEEIAPREVRWLWPGFLPRGKLVLLCGDPGLGKSFITLDIAARCSRGGPWPFRDGEMGPPMRAVLISAEDDPADTIRPRLERMGADLKRISVLEGLEDAQRRVHDFVIGDHSRDLTRLLTEHPDTGLIVVDPVSAYVGASDSYNNAQVRAMLKPLAELAADHGVCVCLVTHLRKSEAQRLLHAAMGSLAFTAAARVVLLVARNPDNPETRYLMTVKSNLSTDRQGFEYRIRDGGVEWVATVEGQADEVLGGGRHAETHDRQKAFVARIKAAIAEREYVPATEAEALARSLGVSYASCSRAVFKRLHGLRSVRRENSWYWATALPPLGSVGEGGDAADE